MGIFEFRRVLSAFLVFLFFIFLLLPSWLLRAEESVDSRRDQKIRKLEERLQKLEDRDVIPIEDKQDFLRQFRWSGYATLEYNNSTQTGVSSSFDLSDFALIVQNHVNQDFDVFAEIEFEHNAELRPGAGQGEIKLEQGYIDWLHQDALNIRMGKFLLPLGIWNQNFWPPLRPTTLSPYIRTTKILPLQGVGLQAYGSFYPWNGELKYRAFVSNGIAALTSGQDRNDHKAVGGSLSFEKNKYLFGVGYYQDLVPPQGVFSKVRSSLGLLYYSIPFTHWVLIQGEHLYDLRRNVVPVLGYVQAEEKLDSKGLIHFVQRGERFRNFPQSNSFNFEPDQWKLTSGVNWKVGYGIKLKAEYQRVYRSQGPDYGIFSTSFNIIF